MNYREILGSCFLGQFAALVNVFQMQGDVVCGAIKQLRRGLLRQLDGFVPHNSVDRNITIGGIVNQKFKAVGHGRSPLKWCGRVWSSFRPQFSCYSSFCEIKVTRTALKSERTLIVFFDEVFFIFGTLFTVSCTGQRPCLRW